MTEERATTRFNNAGVAKLDILIFDFAIFSSIALDEAWLYPRVWGALPRLNRTT